jgi:integrase
MAGSIVEKENGKFLVRVYMGLKDGKRNYHNKQFDKRKDAEKYLTKILHEKNTNTFADAGKITVKEHMETWLETVVKNRVKEKTYLDYKDRVRLYITPEIGDVKLSKLEPRRIQILYAKLIDRGLSSRVVRYVHTLLRNSLQQAVKWGHLYRNPADLVTDELPKRERKEMQALSNEQVKVFMEAAVYSTMKPLFSLLIASGMRPSEALGMKWPDVDFKGKRVTVNRTLTRFNKGGWKLEEPKTPKSRRTIPLPKSTMADLKEHSRNQAEYILGTKEGEYNNQGFVFAANNGEPLSTNNILNRHFKPLLKKAGLPDIRLYDLRHTCATLLLSAGENPKVVSERLGHSTITLTLDTYSHVLPDMQQGAADKLESLLFDKSPENPKPAHQTAHQKKVSEA